MHRFARRTPNVRIGLVTALTVLGAAACDRSPTDADDGHGTPVAAEVYDRASGVLLAETHDGHWDGEIPHLHVGEELALDVRFLDDEGQAVPLDEEWEGRARLADGAPDGIVELHNHGDHIDVEAIAPGETEIVLMLWHGGHPDWESPRLTIEVESEHD